MMTREAALERVISIPPQFMVDKVIVSNLVNEIYDSIVPETTVDKDPWAWVKTEYCALFKAKNPDKGGKVRESVSRMKTMFRARPEIRKEDVILTVKLYLSQTDSRFIRYPHYFLKKGQGANAIYEFDDWYDKYLEAVEAGKGRTSNTNTMQ
tara:strand:+ start:2360 stop:2815 length:456 start_codon:yes stop_codon:yes gene_type:complete